MANRRSDRAACGARKAHRAYEPVQSGLATAEPSRRRWDVAPERAGSRAGMGVAEINLPWALRLAPPMRLALVVVIAAAADVLTRDWFEAGTRLLLAWDVGALVYLLLAWILIARSDDEMTRIRAKHAFLKPLTVPAGSYPNQSEPIASLGSWSFVLTREDLPDDVTYRLAKTLHAVEPTFCKQLAQACETTAANTVAAAPKPELIHPGVMKYFREIGVVK